MAIHWIKTDEQPPAQGVVVLGYWRTVVMESVVLDVYNGWLKAPGYGFTLEKRTEPEYWAEFCNLPDGIERGE